MGGSEEVDALNSSSSTHRRRHRKPSTSRDKSMHRDPSVGRRCQYCDRQHGYQKESCPAYGQQCRRCKKRNHFEKVCWSSAASKSQVCEVQNEELLMLRNGDSDPAYCRLKVNGHTVHFLLDCAVTVNVLPRSEAVAFDPKLKRMRPPESRLTMFDGTELKTLGMLTATVEHPRTRKCRQMDFYVAAKHDRAILGMRACREMDLLSVNTSNVRVTAT